MFESPQDALESLRRVGYLTDETIATTVYLAGKIEKPLMLEGPAGAGKTELAQSIARAAGVDLIRLQCYEGIEAKDAIGDFDKSLQELYVLLKTKGNAVPDWDEIRKEITGRSFFLAGKLLDAIERARRCVLLIDEIDKVPQPFEALLLEVLSAKTISAPKLGTIRATTFPFVIMTSNQERRLGDPLRRRSFYIIVPHPTAELEAEIVKNKTPHATRETHRFIAGLAKALRAYNLEKPPSISEMNDVAQAMELLGLNEILPAHKDIMLPLIAKTEGDRKRLLMKQSFEVIVHSARRHASEMAEREVAGTVSDLVVTV